ncbi:MAG: pyruvate water dikinase [Nitrospirae bacterium]|nr:MAG: pyruvate water dikinase [Nitrospirota bacterium]
MSFFDLFSFGKTCSPLSVSNGKHQVKYQHFRTLLNHNREALRLLAEMEQLYFSGRPFDAVAVKQHYERLYEHVLGLAKSLNTLSGGLFARLADICKGIDADISKEMEFQPVSLSGDMVLPLERVGHDMQRIAGAKAVNLAVMKNSLKLPVPDGFVITAEATTRFLEQSSLTGMIREQLARLSMEDIARLETGCAAIRQMVLDAEVPPEIAAVIIEAYELLETKTHKKVRIALRSSAVGEDTEASFAGQYATVLNVTRADLLDAFRRVVASKYSPRAIAYRQLLGVEDDATPMCMIGLCMVDAQASGVMYTVDPATMDPATVKVSSLWGLGEQLVSGNASPDTFVVKKETGEITERHIANKTGMLVTLAEGGVRLEKTGPDKQMNSSLPDEALRTLCAFGVRIEEYYRTPQDIEWALDADNRLFLLQTRPLHVAPKVPEMPAEDLSGYENILTAGESASYGIASGMVFIAKDEKKLSPIPDNAILVTHTASPSYAEVIGRINGLITDVGSITSHLSSVAREFGVPAIVNAGNATRILTDGDVITMSAESQTAAYRGIVDQLVSRMRPSKKLIIDSPIHRKLRTILDKISPLSLTNPEDPSFSIEECRSFHDVIRFCHEHAMRQMFGISTDAEGAEAAVKIVSHIPLVVYAIDLGGGLKEGLSTCDAVTPNEITSHPMRAIWKGFTQPGISWAGTVNFDARSFMTLMASMVTSEFGPTPGGDSYALLSRDYMNFSAKFGYHFATIDAFCDNDPNHNYVSLQFAGGVGTYFGRSLRVRFLGAVLERLGFQVNMKGDLLEASFNRHDRATTLEALDQLGRLLATSRLLDMALSNQNDVETLTEAFFSGDYDFLRPRTPEQPTSFYLHCGHWRCDADGDALHLLQDGLQWRGPMSGALSDIVGKAFGSSYQEFLDTIGAYYYFPLAIAKNSEMVGNGIVLADMHLESGSIDRAGGIAFGLRNVANYFVFRINALEDNAILFEFVNNKRIQRKSVHTKIASHVWYRLKVMIEHAKIQCLIDDVPLIEYTADSFVEGHVGLWTKADSVTRFRSLTIEDAVGVRTFCC